MTRTTRRPGTTVASLLHQNPSSSSAADQKKSAKKKKKRDQDDQSDGDDNENIPATGRAAGKGPAWKRAKQNQHGHHDAAATTGDDRICQRCQNRLPVVTSASSDHHDQDSTSLCPACLLLSTVPKAQQHPSRRKKAAAGALKPAHEVSLVDDLNRAMLSLQDMCIKVGRVCGVQGCRVCVLGPSLLTFTSLRSSSNTWTTSRSRSVNSQIVCEIASATS